MTHWTDIDTFDGLAKFQEEFRTMTDEERAKICLEMLAHIEAYKLKILVIDHNASTSRDEPPLLRKKRRGRARTFKSV